MALQGTIESFALADVLRLLSQSAKTGRLIVNGDRGSANLWIARGELVGGGSAAQPRAEDVVDVLFDMLRFESGSFIFESDATAPTPQTPIPVVPALEQAEAALAEWHEIVRVVPSVESWVSLAPDLPHAEVVVDQACWTSIVTVGGGIRVAELGRLLDLGELPVSRLVRALVSAGFVEVSAEPPVSFEPAPVATESPDPFESLESVNFEPAGAAGNTSDGLPQLPTRQPSSEVGSTRNGTPDVDAEGRFEQVDDPFGDAAGGVALPSLRISGLTDDPFADSPGSDGNPLQPYADDEWEDRPAEDRAEDLAEEAGADVARSMSMLSPKAAQALAAVAGGDGADGNSDGSPEGGDEQDDSGRSKMLRFLGSV